MITKTGKKIIGVLLLVLLAVSIVIYFPKVIRVPVEVVNRVIYLVVESIPLYEIRIPKSLVVSEGGSEDDRITIHGNTYSSGCGPEKIEVQVTENPNELRVEVEGVRYKKFRGKDFVGGYDITCHGMFVPSVTVPVGEEYRNNESKLIIVVEGEESVFTIGDKDPFELTPTSLKERIEYRKYRDTGEFNFVK